MTVSVIIGLYSTTYSYIWYLSPVSTLRRNYHLILLLLFQLPSMVRSWLAYHSRGCFWVKMPPDVSVSAGKTCELNVWGEEKKAGATAGFKVLQFAALITGFLMWSHSGLLHIHLMALMLVFVVAVLTFFKHSSEDQITLGCNQNI